LISSTERQIWEEEMDLVVDDLKKDEMVKTKGLVIRKAKNEG
jgi:hypothetical protein